MRGLFLVLLVGCSATDHDAIDPTPDAPIVELPEFRSCTGRAFTPDPATDWRHDWLTPIVTAAGAPNHAGRDLIVEHADGSTIRGKFTYGFVSKDLEDEDVRVWIDDCSQWQRVGDFTTDSDGQIAAQLATSLPIGAYEVRYQVLGDRSTTSSTLWVLPRGTRIVVSDIDGTLTASDSELFQQMLDGSHVPVAYPGAVELATAHANRGHVVMYLTGRPDWLTQVTRTWLAQKGFTAGPLRVTDSHAQSVPLESGVGDFKKSVLAGLAQAGYLADFAYGNATTDIYAYLEAGFAPDDVWIIGEHAGEQGTNAVDDWTARASEVSTLAEIIQPFTR